MPDRVLTPELSGRLQGGPVSEANELERHVMHPTVT